MRQKELLLGNKELDLLIDCAQAINLSGASIPGIDKIVDVVDTVDDYETVHALAKGGHSEVFVVRCKSDGKIYALKKVFKQDIINDPLVNPIMKERESMICGRNSEWLLGLHKSFQDRNALYFLTDFIPGGDLGSLSCREGVLPERMIRFFIGELLMALRELHGLGFVHRDIKPENVLIDSDGHIKLADFGSTTSLSANDHHVVVGTPDYVAPELLNMCGGLSMKTDLWSLGVVVYELAFGCSPFYHDTIRGTYDNIMNIRYTMEKTGSAELYDLIKNLLCEKESRLSLNDIMSHAFFAGFDFSGKGANKAEYIPTVLSVESVENFEVDEFMPAQTTLLNTMDNARKFIGFGYDPDIRAEIAKEKKPESSTEKTCLDKMYMGAEVASEGSSSNSTLSVEKECAEEVAQDCSSICSLCKKSTAPLQEEASSVVVLTKERELEEECQEESKTSNELVDTEESDKSTSGQVYDESAQDKEPIITNIEISKKDLQDRKKSLDVPQASEETSFANINTQLDINLECSQEKEKVSAVEKIVKNEDFVCFSGNLGEDLEKRKAQKERENIIAYICEIEESFKMGYEHLLKIDTSPLVKSMEYIEQEIQGFIAAVKESQRRESESAFQARWVIRKLQTEIRDTQGRIEREVETRLKLTEQIEEARVENKELREQIRRLKLASNVYNFPIKIYVDKKWESSTLQLEEDYLRIKDICLPLNKIYFQDIKKNELLRINSKAELLSFKLLLPSEDDVYTEQTESSSDQVACTGENAELKKELEKELQILEGIEKMIRSTSTSCKTIIPMALKQKEGTEKKISEIQQALSQGFAADPTIIRYNNHTFKVTTFKQGVQNWCHVCNRLLYGEVKQGLLCKGCKMVCHKECHTLIVYSCELQQAMERGTSIILMAKQLEDKDRIKAIVGSGQP